MNSKIKIRHKRVKNKISNIFTRFFLSAFFVASFFYTAPIFKNFANKYFNDQKPWSLKEKNPKRMNTILYTILNQIRSISILSLIHI